MEKPEGGETLSEARREVERASEHYYYTPLQMGIDNRTKQFVVGRCASHIKGPMTLDLGYVDGLWTDVVLAHGFSVDIVEGAARHIAHAKAKYGNDARVRLFHQLFQEFAPDCQYDTIIAGDMLRYLPNPLAFLRQSREWLNNDGNLIVTVPNNRSLHRRVGALMGLESTPMAYNTRDQEVGNRASYDRYSLRSLLVDSGYLIKELHGCFLKPLSSAQMQDWSDAMLLAFLEIGDELEDYCWFLYAICQKP